VLAVELEAHCQVAPDPPARLGSFWTEEPAYRAPVVDLVRKGKNTDAADCAIRPRVNADDCPYGQGAQNRETNAVHSPDCAPARGRAFAQPPAAFSAVAVNTGWIPPAAQFDPPAAA